EGNSIAGACRPSVPMRELFVACGTSLLPRKKYFRALQALVWGFPDRCPRRPGSFEMQIPHGSTAGRSIAISAMHSVVKFDWKMMQIVSRCRRPTMVRAPEPRSYLESFWGPAPVQVSSSMGEACEAPMGLEASGATTPCPGRAVSKTEAMRGLAVSVTV